MLLLAYNVLETSAKKKIIIDAVIIKKLIKMSYICCMLDVQAVYNKNIHFIAQEVCVF